MVGYTQYFKNARGPIPVFIIGDSGFGYINGKSQIFLCFVISIAQISNVDRELISFHSEVLSG
jgi:hypothetical protein